MIKKKKSQNRPGVNSRKSFIRSLNRANPFNFESDLTARFSALSLIISDQNAFINAPSDLNPGTLRVRFFYFIILHFNC